MNIDTTMTVDTVLNTGLVLFGYFYIMFSAGKWAATVFLKQWKKTAQTGATPEGIRSVL